VRAALAERSAVETDRQEFLDEGNKIRDQQARELKRLQAIKEAKIQELVKSGVPEHYVSELRSKKIQV